MIDELREDRSGNVWLCTGVVQTSASQGEIIRTWEVLTVAANNKAGRRIGDLGQFGDRFVMMYWSAIKRSDVSTRVQARNALAAGAGKLIIARRGS